MTIVTPFPNSLPSPRGPKKQQPLAAQSPALPRFGRDNAQQVLADQYHLQDQRVNHEPEPLRPKPSIGGGQANDYPHMLRGEPLQPLKSVYRPNVLWVTNERLPVKTGGLGEVSYTISKAAARFGTPEGKENRDFRVVVPYMKTTREQDEEFKALEAKSKAGTLTQTEEKKKYEQLQRDYGQPFQPTNLTITVNVKNKPEKFQVLQAFEDLKDAHGRPILGIDGRPRGNWVYALRNDKLFSNTTNIATYESLSRSSLELLTPFNEAAGKLVPYLDHKAAPTEKPKNGEAELQTFKGPLNSVIGNDWLTGPVLHQPGVQDNRDIYKIFYMHNSYDSGAVPAEEAGHDRGWPLPSFLTKPDDTYSQLTLSLKSADAVVANRNFVKTLTQTDFAKGQSFVPVLKKHFENGTVYDMHHGLAEDFTPTDNAYLRAGNGEYKTAEEYKTQQARDEADAELSRLNGNAAYQFAQLRNSSWRGQGPTRADWAAFKKANKAALQKKYGLHQNPDAVVLSWAARLEPNQKGFYLVQNTLRELLQKNKNLQVLIAGNIGNPKDYGPNELKIAQWIKDMRAEFPGQVYIPNAFVGKREIIQMNSGSDFTILPSLYEPYGLTQLEAIKMGSIPLVNSVDGLRTTVSDPTVETKDTIGGQKVENRPAEDMEEVWNYGQTGVLMGKFDIVAYMQAIARQHSFAVLENKINSSEGNVYRLNADTKEDFKTLRQTLTDSQGRFTNEAQKQQIAALATRLSKPNALLQSSDMSVLRMIHQKDQSDIIQPAEAKYKKAVERALGMSTAQRADVQARGLKFLEDKHNWNTIFNSRYVPLLDAPLNPAHRGEVFKFNHTPPFPRTVTGPTKTDKVTEPDGLMASSWAKFKAAIAAITYYLNLANWFKKTAPVVQK